MVLCAGLGTRLRPLTERWPKPAVPLLAGPLIRYALATLTEAGITSVGVNTHHLAAVMEHVARNECAELTVSHEPDEAQGTGGGIRGLKAFLDSDDFVVLNGDVLFPVDLKPIVSAHRASRAAATLVLLPMPRHEKFNSVDVDASGVVRRIAGHGPGGALLTPWHFTGVHVMSPSVFEFMAPTGPEDINRNVYVRMMERGLEIRGHVLDASQGYWSDLGTPARYAATHQALLAGQVPLAAFGTRHPFAEHPRTSEQHWKHASAHIADDVITGGPAFFGEQCVVEEQVTLGTSVSVGRFSVIGRGARLNRVAVLEGANVEPGAVLTDCIVAPQLRVSTLP
jgi:mannose-1-phosphate guanylyltransferase